MKSHSRYQSPKRKESKPKQFPAEVLTLLPQLLENRLGLHLNLLEQTDKTVKTDLLKVRSNINQLIGNASSLEPKLLDTLITHEPFQEPQEDITFEKEKIKTKASVPVITINDFREPKEISSFLQSDSLQNLSPIENAKTFKDISPWFSPNSKTGTRVELHTPGIIHSNPC